jgi:hypothetical protein
MDIKIETTGNWPVKTEQRARKTTRGEAFTTVRAYARVMFVGSDPDNLLRRSSIGSQLEANLGLAHLPDSMKQWIGLSAEVAITSGGRFRANGVECFDFGFKMTKRGRGHAGYGKQFHALLTELDKAGTLQSIAKKIVEEELERIAQLDTEAAQQFRLKSAASYLVAAARERADSLLGYRGALEALRQQREDKMHELLTHESIERIAVEHQLSADDLKTAVLAAAAVRLSFGLGG